ncbi:MAG: hypothetical protein LBI45_07250 [Bacteroidales bacterium]|jgi:hypothetical protein|nr:hypothetical protein [Bacteroidales bacterium]
MKQYIYFSLDEKTEIKKSSPHKKKRRFIVGEVVEGGVKGIFSGVTNLFKSKKSANAPRSRFIIDKRTGGIDLSYITAIIAVIVVVVIAAWLGFKKLRSVKK